MGEEEEKKKSFQRGLIVAQHDTVEKSGEDPVYKVTLKSVLKDEATQTAITLKISTGSKEVSEKFCNEEHFIVSLHKQPKLGEQ